MLSLIDKKLARIRVDNFSFKCTAYADDLTIGIGSLSDWTTVLGLLEKYKKASNSRINKLKSYLMPLTSTARRIELPEEALFKN